MTTLAALVDHFNALCSTAAAARGDAVVERTVSYGEHVVRFTCLSDCGAASACLWARESVGGLIDMEVIDDSGAGVLWRHLEGPTPVQLTASWNEMMSAFNSSHAARRLATYSQSKV